MTLERAAMLFRRLVPAVEFWSLRLVEQRIETLCMRQHLLRPPGLRENRGAHLTLVDDGGVAWAATCELTEAGLRHACEHARGWLETSRRHALFPASAVPRPARSGEYAPAPEVPWDSWPLESRIALLAEVNQRLKLHDRIVDWQARLRAERRDVLLTTSDGVEIAQRFHLISPGFLAVANRGTETQIRTGGGTGSLAQAGLEGLRRFRFPDDATRVAEEALALLDAPECPSERRDLILMPDQMMLQVHESIGHPLELDRILGDERNLAGGSFVTPDMFGSFRYGADCLNVRFDPDVPMEAGSYAFDDEGTPAEAHYLIRHGILRRPLGGALSQARAGMDGVACARAEDWSRAAIDRMGNVNVEPGDHSLPELIERVERGVLMQTNRSWSIDDHRNKFQFSCEMGRRIENGELKGLVRNPGYRGLAREFWRNLAAVGTADTWEVWGTADCGKGEPNQLMQVGHASPPGLFGDVEVFGGD